MLNTNSYFDCKLTPVEQADANDRAANLGMSPDAKARRRSFLEDSKEKHFQLTAAAGEIMKGFEETPAGTRHKHAWGDHNTTLASDWY